MYNLGQLFTLGNWLVIEGKAKEFTKEWKSFADWTLKNNFGSGTPYLLQDIKNPRHFISFGPWPDLETVQKWREAKEFKRFAAKINNLCEKFDPYTLKLIEKANRPS